MSFAFLFFVQVMASRQVPPLSRKTYLIRFCSEGGKTLFVSLANTAIGIFTLIGAGLGALAGILGVQITLWMFAGLLLLASGIGTRLKEV